VSRKSKIPVAARGEVAATIGGKPVIMCLTIRHLAQLETMFGAESFADTMDRLQYIRAADLAQVVELMTDSEITADEAGRLPASDVPGILRALQDVIVTAFGGGEDEKKSPAASSSNESPGENGTASPPA